MNTSRGGLVDERALVAALEARPAARRRARRLRRRAGGAARAYARCPTSCSRPHVGGLSERSIARDDRAGDRARPRGAPWPRRIRRRSPTPRLWSRRPDDRRGDSRPRGPLAVLRRGRGHGAGRGPCRRRPRAGRPRSHAARAMAALPAHAPRGDPARARPRAIEADRGRAGARLITAEQGKHTAEARAEAGRIAGIVRLCAEEARPARPARSSRWTRPPPGRGRLGYTRPGARRGRGRDHAVQLPRDPRHPQDRPRARGGQRGRAQAGRGDAADRAPPRRPPRRRRPAAQARSSCLTGAGATLGAALCGDPRVRQISFTGSHEVGPGDRPRGRRQAPHVRAGLERRAGRARRRRPRARRRGDRLQRLHERGPELRLDAARARARAAARRAARARSPPASTRLVAGRPGATRPPRSRP